MYHRGFGVLWAAVGTLAVVGVLAAAVWFVALPWMRGFTLFAGFGQNQAVVGFHEYFGLAADVPQVILDGSHLHVSSTPIAMRLLGEDHVFLPESFLREHFDPFLFFDARANIFSATNRYDLLNFVPHSGTFTHNGRSQSLSEPIRIVDGEIFMPKLMVLGMYPIRMEFVPELNFIVITTAGEHYFSSVTADEAFVRFRADDNAPIAAIAAQGEQLLVFNRTAANGFSYVRTSDGLLGYVLADQISTPILNNVTPANPPMFTAWFDNFVDHPPANWPEGVMINMAWENPASFAANASNMENPPRESLNVLSPKWFRLDPAGTHLNSIVSPEYIRWAAAQGIQVWPIVFDMDFESAANFFPYCERRQRVLEQIIGYVDAFGLAGINIDFEHLDAAHGRYKIQFLRELAIQLRARNVVLSACVLIPAPWTAFYRHDLIGLTVDFVMLMAYDEHWSTSPVAGPVASLPWVSRAVEGLVDLVSPDKIVLGLPFYNTMWRERLSDGNLTVRQVGINWGRSFFEERGVEWVWDPEVASYFGEVAVIEYGETIIWRVWLECPRSIGAKMQLVSAHNLRGVAGWHRGLETPEVWTVIEHFMR